MLIDAHWPMEGPFPFHAEGSESVWSVEVGKTSGPSSGLVGAEESAAPSGVPPEDRWMGGGGSATAPEVLMEDQWMGRCRSTATPEVLMEGAALLPRPLS